MKALKILLVEDNQTIASQVIEFLEGHGWTLDYAATGKQGMALASAEIYDLVLLDLNLPDVDGLQVCEHIKQHAPHKLPVLMLTARDAFEDKAKGFYRGADDYVTKPFELRELALRCQALARRHELHTSQTLQIGDLHLDLGKRQATRAGQPLTLTHIGFTLLTGLAKAYPNALTRSELIHLVWGDEPPPSDALKSHMYSLRNALDKPFDQSMLRTLTNVGYRLEHDA